MRESFHTHHHYHQAWREDGEEVERKRGEMDETKLEGKERKGGKEGERKRKENRRKTKIRREREKIN